MQLRKRLVWLAVLTVLLVAGTGALVGRAATNNNAIAVVDVQGIFDTYIAPVVNDTLKPDVQKLQTELDSKTKGLSDDAKAKMFQEYQARLDSKKQEVINANLSKLNGIIKQVAQESGYDIVLQKDMVVLGGTDLTSKVIAKWKAAK